MACAAPPYNWGVDPEQLSAIVRKHDIRLLLQFGSTVSGHAHASSDMDVAVLLAARPASLEAHAELIADLQALLPDRDVDVALINGADPLFLKQITERCRLLSGTPSALHELKMYAFTRYQDHRRFLEMEREYVRDRIRVLAR